MTTPQETTMHDHDSDTEPESDTVTFTVDLDRVDHETLRGCFNVAFLTLTDLLDSVMQGAGEDVVTEKVRVALEGRDHVVATLQQATAAHATDEQKAADTRPEVTVTPGEGVELRRGGPVARGEA